MIIQNTSTIQNQQSFSNWMVTNYPVTPYYSYTIYFIILLVVSSVLLFKILFHENLRVTLLLPRTILQRMILKGFSPH